MIKQATVILFVLWLALLAAPLLAQEAPYFEYTWTAGDGTVAIPADDLQYFGQGDGRYEVDWTPSRISFEPSELRAQVILEIPNHLALWTWKDGIHGNWYQADGTERLFRARWGLPAAGVEVHIVVTWNDAGYAVIVDDVLRIHDWQTTPTTEYPDPDAVSGVYGSAPSGERRASGTFTVRVYGQPLPYDSCTVDVVGTINANVPLDNTGAWDQGIDPECGPVNGGPTGSATLSWIAPTENEDGTPLTDLDGYKIYYGTTPGDYSASINITDESRTTWVVDGLAPGTYYFVATAYNTQGVESVLSNEADKVVEAAVIPTVPCAPTGFTVE